LNTDATFLTNDDDVLKRETKGDASESAIIKFVEPIRNITEYRKAHTRICSIPFNSNNKWMCAIHEVDDRYILFFKGAPERIMNMCTSAYFKGRNHDMTEALREDFEDINEELAKRGERVLAFAHLELPKDKFPKGFRFDAEAETPNFPLTGLVLVGFLSLIDPPRPSVKPSILECGQAGIRVIMITGDHPTTAHAIAKSINIITGPTQEELDEL
jgi:sodium/potassium-transporting ATPase subunit alpha